MLIISIWFIVGPRLGMYLYLYLIFKALLKITIII